MYTIENKTILLPEIIAQGAFWEALEEDSNFSKLTPKECSELENKCVQLLVNRANGHYQNNLLFRKQITNNEAGRNRLWAFMRHWSYSLLKKYKNNQPLNFDQ